MTVNMDFSQNIKTNVTREETHREIGARRDAPYSSAFFVSYVTLHGI